MKRSIVAMFALALLFAGCGSYNALQTPRTEPKNMSYCQRLDDMAVGFEPFMIKDKTALTFDGDLRKDEVLALDVSMVSDGGTDYKVKKSEVSAVDEFGNKYSPIPGEVAAERMERVLRRDKPMLYDDMRDRDMPDEVTVLSGKMEQHFLFFDMRPSKASSRRFTLYILAASADGGKHKEFRVTVDPLRGLKNPAERWDSYDARGVTPCGGVKEAAVRAPAKGMDEEAARKAEEAARRAEEAARKAEEAAKKQERVFEKQQMK